MPSPTGNEGIIVTPAPILNVALRVAYAKSIARSLFSQNFVVVDDRIFIFVVFSPP